MMIHDITAIAGKFKKRKRVGRGEGSGHGKQSGRGNKGAGSRSGTSAKKGFEGGQMRYFRRLAKFGFTNAPFKVKFWTVNLGDIVAHPNFAKGGEVNVQSLIKAGLVRDESRDLKILGNVQKGSAGVKVKLNVEASRVSASAVKLVEAAGGSVKQRGTRRDFVRGVNPAKPDATPSKLTKKLHRGAEAAKARASRMTAAASKPEAKSDAKPESKKSESKPQQKPE
jgi:large subunit ribosomal protein L15